MIIYYYIPEGYKIFERGAIKKEMKFNRLFVMSILVLVLAFSIVSAVQPFGASTVTEGASTRAPADSPQTNAAIAGNVTELTISGSSITQAWQGYFGNVTGSIQLADSSNNVLYNWSLADPEGEVYASTSNSIAWASVACYDLATNGDALETTFGIDNADVDGLDETFNSATHSEFYTNSVQFAANGCNSTAVYDSTQASVAGNFEEVLLTDGSDIIFTSILEESAVNGFDGADHDFEMLVLEDGHLTDVATTTYYFYVELE